MTTDAQFRPDLHRLWDGAVQRYRQGRRGAAGFFDAAAEATLAHYGITPQELYDFAEDFANFGQPTFETVLAVQSVRLEYFRTVQNSRPSTARIDPATLPSKSAALAGIEWLPRITEKAKAKLRGELDPDIMYACGGDRYFFAANGVEAAPFLRAVWQNWDQPAALAAWVKAQSKA